MGQTTAIEWCHHTFNPWWGCVKVSDACRHCYAETWAKRTGFAVWGPTERRRFFGPAHWQEPRKWHAAAEREGVRRRVFCASMADIGEQLPPGHPDTDAMAAARCRLWDLIEETPALDWLLLTKRPENIRALAPPTWWGHGFPANVWLGTTAETQEQVERRLPHLIDTPAAVRFLSCEPLLECLYLGSYLSIWEDQTCQRRVIDWVIAGGESGLGARPMHLDWARSLRNQCLSARVPFFFKQWGDWQGQLENWPEDYVLGPQEAAKGHCHLWPDGELSYRVGKRRAGRLLDGRTWDEFPEVARV